MAAQRAKQQRAGNARLYIGLPWHKRKSLPRDSRGFEPLDGYFLKRKAESDSDSSETDTEELIRQEIARRKEEKQARLEAKKKAALAVEETLANGHVGEKERVAEGEGVNEKETVTDIEGLENDTTGKTDTLLPQANETVGTETNGSEQVSHEELYSPQKSIMTMSPHRTMKVVPSRLSFSSSSESEEATDDTKSTGRRKKGRRNIVSKPPRKTTSTKELTTVTVEPGDHGDTAGESTEVLSSGVQQDTVTVEGAASRKSLATDESFHPRKTSTQVKTVSVQNHVRQKPSARKQMSSIHPVAHSETVESAASGKSLVSTIDVGSFHPRKTSTQTKTVSVQNEKPTARKQISNIHPAAQVSDNETVQNTSSGKSIMSTTDGGSFHPRKTSTQMKAASVQNGVERKPAARKQISSIHPVMQVSDSESEDETLTTLLGNHNQPDLFQGLSQLTHSRSVLTAHAAAVSAKKSALAKKQPTKPGRKRKTAPSEANAGEDGKSRKSVRKSVMFVAVPPLPASPRKSMNGTTTGPSAAPTPKPHSSGEQGETVVDPYDDLSELDDSPPRIVSPVKKVTAQALSKTASSESLSASSPKKTVAQQKPTPKKTARKSILKEFSVVIQKEPSPPQRQWFVPDEVGTMLMRRSSKTNVSQHTQSRHPSRENPASSGRGREDGENHQAKPSQETTLLSRRGRKGSEKSAASTSRTRTKRTSQRKQAIEDSDDDLPPASPGMDALDGPSRVSGLEDSAGSQRGVSALNHEEENNDSGSGVSDAGSRVLGDSKRPSRRKRVTRVVLNDKPKRRKKKPTVAETCEREDGDQFWSDEEEGERDGLDITYSAGGRKYRRLRVQPSKSHTPGVRRGKRTRIAPVRTWENEEVEYDMRRRSGAVIKSVLVPLEDSTLRRKRKRTAKALSESEDEEEDFPPVKITDRAGNVLEEKFVVKSSSSKEKINPWGEPAEKWDQVVITRLHSTLTTSNGMILFRSRGEKERSNTGSYDMFFYVWKGRLLFKINSQEYRLKPQMEIHIPARTVYSIRNPQRSHAEVFYYTHRVTESNT